MLGLIASGWLVHADDGWYQSSFGKRRWMSVTDNNKQSSTNALFVS